MPPSAQAEFNEMRRQGVWLSDSAVDRYLTNGFRAQSLPQVANRGINTPSIPISILTTNSGHIDPRPEAVDRALSRTGRIWVSETIRTINEHFGPERVGNLVRQLMQSNPEMIVVPIQLTSMSHQSAIIISRQNGGWQATFFDPMGDKNANLPEWQHYREAVTKALGPRNISVHISRVALQKDVSSCVPITADFLAKAIANPELRNAPNFPENITTQIKRDFPDLEKYAYHARQKVVDNLEYPERTKGTLATEAKLQSTSRTKIRFGELQQSADLVAHEPEGSLFSRLVKWAKGLKLAGVFSLLTSPISSTADLSQGTNLVNSVAGEFKLGLPRQATSEFSDIYAVAKGIERIGQSLDVREIEQAQQLPFNLFIEWGRKYSIPIEAMIRLNPTSAKAETIERSMNNGQGILVQSETPEPNIYLAQAQATQVGKPEGVTIASTTEPSTNPAMRTKTDLRIG